MMIGNEEIVEWQLSTDIGVGGSTSPGGILTSRLMNHDETMHLGEG
jgi:hypothetical protein